MPCAVIKRRKTTDGGDGRRLLRYACLQATLEANHGRHTKGNNAADRGGPRSGHAALAQGLDDHGRAALQRGNAETLPGAESTPVRNGGMSVAGDDRWQADQHRRSALDDHETGQRPESENPQGFPRRGHNQPKN